MRVDAYAQCAISLDQVLLDRVRQCALCSAPVLVSTLLSTCSSWRLKPSWMLMYFPTKLPEYLKHSSKGKSSEYVKYPGMRLKALRLSTRSLQLPSTQASLPGRSEERSGGRVKDQSQTPVSFSTLSHGESATRVRSVMGKSCTVCTVHLYVHSAGTMYNSPTRVQVHKRVYS